MQRSPSSSSQSLQTLSDQLLTSSPGCYAPGTALYFWSRREQGRQMFTPIEVTVFVVLVIGCLAGIYGLASGQLEL
jgi:hypothetical protein